MEDGRDFKDTSEIYSLTLLFPHGTTVAACDEIARRAQNLVSAGVSEGGFKVLKDLGTHLAFSDNDMEYYYGHKRDARPKERPRPRKVNFVDYAVKPLLKWLGLYPTTRSL